MCQKMGLIFSCAERFRILKTTTVKTTESVWWRQNLKFIQPLYHHKILCEGALKFTRTQAETIQPLHARAHLPSGSPSFFKTLLFVTFTVSGWFSYSSFSEHGSLTVLPPPSRWEKIWIDKHVDSLIWVVFSSYCSLKSMRKYCFWNFTYQATEKFLLFYTCAHPPWPHTHFWILHLWYDLTDLHIWFNVYSCTQHHP